MRSTNPLAAILANGEASLRWLNRDQPNLDEVRNAVSRITQDASRAGKMVENLRGLTKKFRTTPMGRVRLLAGALARRDQDIASAYGWR
jgi:N-acetylglutamate synthase/N-acetylornithine aminotransferase